MRTPRGLLRVLLASSAALVLVGVATTQAAYTDQANLNLGSSGIGYQGRFDIGLVLPNGTVQQADTSAGYDWTVPGAASLVPGGSVTTAIPVFNNTPELRADTSFEVVLRNGDGRVSASIPNITSQLRFTATTPSGATLFSNVTWDQARGSLGTLAPRGSGPLAQGASYSAGATGSATTLTLQISYPRAAGQEALNGGQSAMSVHFSSSSVAP